MTKKGFKTKLKVIKHINFFILLIIFLFTSCQLIKSNVIGAYTIVENKTCIDTIFLKNNNEYVQKIYNTKNELVKTRIGNWEYHGNISIDNLFINLDRNVDMYPELIYDGMNVTTPLRYKNWERSFCVGNLLDDLCYQQVD